MKEATLFAAYGADRSAIAHVPAEHELRRAYESAKTLAEQLELAGLPELQRTAVAIREGVFAELLRLVGVEEVAPSS